jgi:hypothetical protein
MNLFGLAFLLIIIPSIIQLVFGSLAITKRITFAFEYISLLSCFGQLLFIYLALKIIEIDTQNQNVRCGMPQAAMFFGGIFLTVILLLIIIIQLFIRRKINKRKTQ